LGNAVAGLVIAAGDQSGRDLIGSTVVTATGGSGGYSELVDVPVGEPFLLPASIDPATGLALLADGRTALGLVRATDIGTSDRVLVLAAGGGVGTLLVQLARARGAALVVAAASRPEKLALARELGVDLTVDYTTAGWAADQHRSIGDLSGSTSGHRS
jgi:NADPH2:quinone reductase